MVPKLTQNTGRKKNARVGDRVESWLPPPPLRDEKARRGLADGEGDRGRSGVV